MQPRQILAVSSNALREPEPHLLLLKHVLAMTGKPEPRVCFLPTARGDAADRIVLFYETMNRLPARPRHRRMFISSSETASFEDELLSADTIFVSGGNTLNILAIWKSQGVDALLRKAYEKGTVLAGESAGALCWFQNGSTDSRPGRLTAIDCLGILQGSFCPHYDAEKDRRPRYHAMIASGELSDGIAADEHVGLVYENERFIEAITPKEGAYAYRVSKRGDKVVEERITPRLLA